MVNLYDKYIDLLDVFRCIPRMTKNILLFIGALQVANASTVLSDIGTDPSDTMRSFTNTTFTGVNQSAEYLAAVAGDSLIDYSRSDQNFNDNNNPLGFTDYRVRISVLSLSGTGSIIVSDALDTDAANNNSFNVTTEGEVSSFSFSVEYIDDAGTLLGLAGRLSTDDRFGPLAHVLNLSGESVDLGLGLLDGNGDVIQGQDYNQITNSFNGLSFASNGTIESQASTNGGIMEFTLANNQRGNIFNFDDGDDDQNDFHSGSVFEITATDGSFADESRFNISFDSQLIAPVGVPEPSSTALIAMGAFGLLIRRKR